MVPEGWGEVPLGRVVRMTGGGTPSKSNSAYWGGEIPWVSPKDFGRPLSEASDTITPLAVSESSTNLVSNESILLVVRSGVLRHSLPVAKPSLSVAINQDLKALTPAANLDREFLFYLLVGSARKILSGCLNVGTTVESISSQALRALPVLLPPLPEQKKIAEILSSVDEAIAATQKVIDQTERVKKGLLQTLVTRGVGHTRFKQTEIGEIPEDWEVVKLGEVVRPIYPSVEMKNHEGYRPVVIRRRHRGVECPEEKLGKSILVKKQFRATPGAFAISKRQVVHGSCGMVPEGFSPNAIVSKEYLQLESRGALRMAFLDLFSHGIHFRRTIDRCTYGVDREKFVLNERWFFRDMVPVPPLPEQDNIVAAVRSVGSGVAALEQELTTLRQLKRGLMHDLLTGRVRVKVA